MKDPIKYLAEFNASQMNDMMNEIYAGGIEEEYRGNDIIDFVLINEFGIHCPKEDNYITNEIYERNRQYTLSLMSEEDKLRLNIEKEIIDKFTEDHVILNDILYSHPLSKCMNLKPYFKNELKDLYKESYYGYGMYSMPNYNNIYNGRYNFGNNMQQQNPNYGGYNNYYTQNGAYQQQQYGANQYIDLTGATRYTQPYNNYYNNFGNNSYFSSFGNYGGYYNNNYNTNYNNQMNIINQLAKIQGINVNNNYENNNNETYNKIYREIYEYYESIYRKYKTISKEEIYTLVNAYGITDDLLNSEYHFQALDNMREEKIIQISEFVEKRLIECGVYSKLKNNLLYTANRFFAENPVNKTNQDYLNERRRYFDEKVRQSHNSFIQNIRKREYEKFIKSDNYLNIHGIQSPYDVLNNYRSSTAQLIKHLEGNKDNFTKLGEGNNTIKREIGRDGSLNISASEELKNALNNRKMQAREAYEAGKFKHQ